MNRKILGFSALMFITFSAHSLINTQIIPFLTEVGYSAAERGYIMAFYAFLAMIGQFVAGYLCDRYRTIRRFFIYACFILSVFGIFAYGLQMKLFWVHFMLMGTAVAFVRIAGNLLETWIIEVDGLYAKFGEIRSLGSLGWALSSLISGKLISQFGFGALGITSGIINVLAIGFSFYLEDANKAVSKHMKFKDVGQLFKNKKYLLIILIYTLTYMVYNADSVTVSDLILAVGGTPETIGVKWFVQALSELPLMLSAAYILRRLKGKKMMIVGGLALGLRYCLYALFPNATAIVIISTLQMVSFPFILVSQKELVLHETPAHLTSSGQMVSIAFTSGFAAIVTPIIVGLLSEYIPIQMLVMYLGWFMIIPVLLMLLYKERSFT